MNNSKLIALLTFLGEGTDTTEIIINDENTAEIDGEEYKVFTDEEADQEFEEYQENLFDEMGIESFSPWAQEYILNNFIESDWFDEAMKESYEFYIDDIKYEAGRLEEEMEEAGVENEGDFLDYLCEQYEDGIEYYRENFGEEGLSNVVKKYNLVDTSKVIDWVKDTDGRGASLASYNGEENEENGYYIYRTN